MTKYPVVTFDVWAHPPIGTPGTERPRHLGQFNACDHRESAMSDVRPLLRQHEATLSPASRIEIIRPNGQSFDVIDALPTVDLLLRW